MLDILSLNHKNTQIQLINFFAMPPTPHTHTDQTRSAEHSFLNTTGLKQHSKTIDINDF